MRLLLQPGLDSHIWEEKEVSVLRAECSGEAVRWDEVGEEQRSQLDVFLMRE